MATGGDKLKPHAAQLEAWAIEAVPVAEQVKRLAKRGVQVDRRAIYKWRHRHPDAISVATATVKQVVVGRSQSIAIADRSERIRRAGIASDKVLEWIEAHGLISETQTVGEDGKQITDHRFNRGLVSALVDLNTYVSKELGEFPTPGVNFNTGDTYNLNLVNLADYPKEQQDAILRLALRTPL